MKYNKSTKIITLVIIVVFLFATFGTVVLYLASPSEESTIVELQPEINAEDIEITQPEIVSVGQNEADTSTESD